MKNLLYLPFAFFINNALKLRFSYIDKVFNSEKKKKVTRWTLLLPGSGCAWAKNSDGCHMCGFKVKIDQVNRGKPASITKLMTIFQLGKSLTRGSSPYSLSIYNGGSFFNEEEIPLEVQEEICREVERSSSIAQLIVESRPEFITDDKIELITSLLKRKKLKVAIGLEAVSDYVRDVCINKGFSTDDYEGAVEILKKNAAETSTYVFLKPIYLSEQESIEEAVRTIRYALSRGSNEVLLESAFIQRGTKMEKLYREGEFQPPWLWSIIEVVRRTSHLGPVYIGGFEDEPPPIAIPHNCEMCSPRLMRSFRDYNESLDVSLLHNGYCACKVEWEKEVGYHSLDSLLTEIKSPIFQPVSILLST
jgi:radical SAM enzyme (TIGR01210 family)